MVDLKINDSGTIIDYVLRKPIGSRSNRKCMEVLSDAKQTRLKVVVRRLPARLPESVFLEAAKEFVNDEITDWRAYYPGKQRKNVGPSRQEGGKPDTMTRAYIHFKSHETLMAFFQGFNGHLFVDRQGKENRAMVEYAAYQQIPKDVRNDGRQGKLHESPEFHAFVEKLKNGETKVSLQQQSEQPLDQSKTTPLIEYLRKKSEKPKKSRKDKLKTGSAAGGKKDSHGTNNGIAGSASVQSSAVPSQGAKAIPDNNQMKPKRRPRGRGRGEGLPTIPSQQIGPINGPLLAQHSEANGGPAQQRYEDRKSERPPERQGRGRGRGVGRRGRRGRGGDGPIGGNTLQSNTF